MNEHICIDNSPMVKLHVQINASIFMKLVHNLLQRIVLLKLTVFVCICFVLAEILCFLQINNSYYSHSNLCYN